MPLKKSYLSCWMALVAAFLFLFTTLGSLAQSSGNVMPSQPAALMEMVAQRNALETGSLKPWRLVIRVQPGGPQGEGKKELNAGGTADAAGESKEIRIEEIWMNPHRYKISYQIQDHAWQVYGADTGQMIVGEPARPDFWGQALREFVGPIADDKTRASWILHVKDQTVGNAKLKCLSVTGYEIKGEKRSGPGMTYCIDEDKPDLRLSASPFTQWQTVHNGVRVFQGQYVPERVEMVSHEGPLWKAELENLEQSPQLDEAALIAPPEAKPVVRKIAISAGVAQGNLESQVPPSYPPAAMRLGVHGTVVLQATIEKDGKVSNLSAISGPTELRQGAIDAVKQWKYRPYLLNGEPVAVDTTINVVFNLGRQ